MAAVVVAVPRISCNVPGVAREFLEDEMLMYGARDEGGIPGPRIPEGAFGIIPFIPLIEVMPEVRDPLRISLIDVLDVSLEGSLDGSLLLPSSPSIGSSSAGPVAAGVRGEVERLGSNRSSSSHSSSGIKNSE